MIAALLVGATAASADSIVYVKDHNVWLAEEDGSGEYQVTLDGTASDPYESPSQADDGTIVAIRGSGSDEKLYLMAQNGSLLATPFEPAVEFSLGLFDAALSPDGERVAYWTGFFGNTSCDLGSSGTTACYGTYMSPSDGPGDIGGHSGVSDPHWVSDTRIMTTVTGFAYLQDAGTTGGTQWFTDIDTLGTVKSFYDGEVAPGGDRLALVEDNSSPTPSQADTVHFWRTNGDPASGTPSSVLDPTSTTCALQGPAGRFAEPTWAEDGGLIAWEEDDGDPATAPTSGQGVWTMTVGSWPPPSNCSGFGTPALVLPGGTAPDIGPAPVNPAPRNTGGTGGGSGGTGGGTGGTGSGTGVTPGPGPVCCQPPVDQRAPVATARLAGRAPKLRQALSRGLPLLVSSDEAGSVTVELLGSGRYAPRVAVLPAATRRAGIGRGQLAAQGRVRVVARFTAKAKRRYRRLRRVPLTVRVVVTDGAGNQTVRQLRTTLRR